MIAMHQRPGLACFTGGALAAVALAVGTAIGTAPASASTPSSTNLLANPSFEQAGATGPYWHSGVPGTSPAAAGWTTYMQPVPNPVMTEDLLPPPPGAPAGAGTRMLHVTDNGYGGIVQAFMKPGAGPAHGSFSVWVFVVRGSVRAGLGNGGSTSLTSAAAPEGVWTQLSGHESTTPVNEFVVYGTEPGYNDYYVDLASVTPTG
jgi:hypothetical protein